MEPDIIISPGMERITIHDLLHGDMDVIGIHILAGVFQLVMVMDGLVGASIPTDMDIGAQEVIEEDTVTGITGVIIEEREQDIAQVTGQDIEILPETSITTDQMEWESPGIWGMPRLEKIWIIRPDHQPSPTICIPTGMAMWASEIRMAIGNKNRTGPPVQIKDKIHKQGPRLVKVNKWIVQLKTEVEALKIIIIQDRMDLAAAVEPAVEEEAAEEGSSNFHLNWNKKYIELYFLDMG
jgi:hypothetical protein